MLERFGEAGLALWTSRTGAFVGEGLARFLRPVTYSGNRRRSVRIPWWRIDGNFAENCARFVGGGSRLQVKRPGGDVGRSHGSNCFVDRKTYLEKKNERDGRALWWRLAAGRRIARVARLQKRLERSRAVNVPSTIAGDCCGTLSLILVQEFGRGGGGVGGGVGGWGGGGGGGGGEGGGWGGGGGGWGWGGGGGGGGGGGWGGGWGGVGGLWGWGGVGGGGGGGGGGGVGGGWWGGVFDDYATQWLQAETALNAPVNQGVREKSGGLAALAQKTAHG